MRVDVDRSAIFYFLLCFSLYYPTNILWHVPLQTFIKMLFIKRNNKFSWFFYILHKFLLCIESSFLASMCVVVWGCIMQKKLPLFEEKKITCFAVCWKSTIIQKTCTSNCIYIFFTHMFAHDQQLTAAHEQQMDKKHTKKYANMKFPYSIICKLE